MNPLLHLDGFDGVARLFPLPNFVMMPHVVKAFHIFEPRYRELTEDALKKDKLITLVLPRDGWDKNYEGSFGIHDIGCLTLIQEHERLEDGRFNLELRGLSRVELEHELLTSTLYRQAKVKLLPDAIVNGDSLLRKQIEEDVLPWLAVEGEGRQQFHKLLNSTAPLGTIVDVVSFALPLPSDWKQELLEILSVPQRVKRLGELLHSVKPFLLPEEDHPNSRRITPDFSKN
ncbi:MAG TPA: LON peptidase substrate-binding domain-containing protein [Gemmatales bacterium]|nr:LON peptidase substrate-binding domain-containing protein [Gemmatales bacterium]